MEHVTKIVPFLWELVGRNKRYSANVTTKENEITVNILRGKRSKFFRNPDAGSLMADIRKSFRLA